MFGADVEIVMPGPAITDTAPVKPLTDATEPAVATDPTVAYFKAPEAALSAMTSVSPDTGDAFCVRLPIVKSVGAAGDPVVFPLKVYAPPLACIAFVT